jgi:molybdate transport system permease protein
MWTDLTNPATKDALRLSLECSAAAAALSALFGIPLAWVLARSDFPGRRLTRALVLLPMVLPPVVGGIALFFAVGPRGLLGQYLDRWFGITLPFTTFGAIVAETFVAMPFLIITVEAALRGVDRRSEEAASTLGASRWTVFRRVTVPLIGPSLLAGFALSWARALGEFGATITFAGSLQGKTETMPLAIFIAFEHDPATAIALSLVLVVISVAVLVSLRDRWLIA